jgi:hypothetical protein
MSDQFAPKVVSMPGSGKSQKQPQPKSGGGNGGDKAVNPLEVGKVSKDVAGEVVSEVREVASQMTRIVTMENVVSQIFGQPGTGQQKVEYLPTGNQDQGQPETWKKKYAQERMLHKETLHLIERRKREREVQIKEVRAHIQLLTKSVAQWSHEVDTAVFQAPVEVSIYHESFFEKLLSFITSLKKRIDDSTDWVAMHNSRSTKKGAFWAMAMKGGKLNQQYAFSGERKAAWK